MTQNLNNPTNYTIPLLLMKSPREKKKIRRKGRKNNKK
jgi:hypothetical protein